MEVLDKIVSKPSAGWRDSKKQAHYQNHLRFNLRCRDEDITPASLNIKNPIPTRNAEIIIKKARKALMKERTRGTVNKIDRIDAKMEEEMDSFKTHFLMKEDTQKEINAHLKSAYKQEFAITKNQQIKKLEKLIEKKSNKQTKAEINEKWVHNLSKRTLTETEKKGLGQGLNFAITPRRMHPSDRTSMPKKSRITDRKQKYGTLSQGY